MLSKDNRLRHEKDIKALFSKGKSAFGIYVSMKYRPNQLSENRFAVVIGTKIAKRAVVRNRLRRQIRAIVGKHLSEMKSGFDIALLPKKEALGKKSHELEEEILSILKKKTPIL